MDQPQSIECRYGCGEISGDGRPHSTIRMFSLCTGISPAISNEGDMTEARTPRLTCMYSSYVLVQAGSRWITFLNNGHSQLKVGLAQ